MQFVTQTVPGEITLMFVSYLLFCTVLMYLFVRTDREWGRLEASLDDSTQRQQASVVASAMLFSSADIEAESMLGETAMRKSLQHCAEHHQLDCDCFLYETEQSKV